MQAVDHAPSRLPIEDVKPPRGLRKANQSYERRFAPTSDPGQKADIELPSPASSNASLAHGKKRSAASQDDVNGAEAGELSDREHSRAPGSTSSSPGEHVCLCQPEPKIPRPRNGESDVLFVTDGGYRSAPDLTPHRTKNVALSFADMKWWRS